MEVWLMTEIVKNSSITISPESLIQTLSAGGLEYTQHFIFKAT